MNKCLLCGIHKEIVKEANSKQMRWSCWGLEKYIYKCLKCGLMWIYPSFTPEELTKLYDGYCDQKDFPGQKQAVRISKYLLKYIPKGLIGLEIGCGKGDNVKFLRKNKRETIGIDKDPTYCDGVIIFNKDYKDILGQYDYIYAIQVFEHLEDPINFINKLKQLLVSGGKFLLEMPNTEDPILSLYHIEDFKKFYYIPHHLFFWTPSTLKDLFVRNGIPNVKVKLLQKYGIINHLRWAIFKRPGNFHPHIWLLDDIYKFILTKILHKSDTIILLGEKDSE